MTNEAARATRWFVSRGATRAVDVPGRLLRDLGNRADPEPEAPTDVVIALASEVLDEDRGTLPGWAIGPGVWYLLVADVPTQALMRLPTILRIHRPDQRLHVTEDRTAIRRMLVAQARPNPFEGIVDAYAVADAIVLVLGDATLREFPRARILPLRRLPGASWKEFEIDPDGSFLYWPEGDIHLGASQMLQAVDPSFLADVATRRYDADRSGESIQTMREARGLRQADIPGLSERQVRRIEQGVSRLTSHSASKLAAAFDLTAGQFLEELPVTGAPISTGL